MLEPCAVKVACTVLRGGGGSDVSSLPDEADRRDDPARSELRPIVPVVFYQGARGWSHSTEFADLFPEGVRALQWVPRFAHELLDQTTLEPEAVGSTKNSGAIAELGK